MLILVGFKLKDWYKSWIGLIQMLILVGFKLKDGYISWIGLIQKLNRIDKNVDIGWIPFPFLRDFEVTSWEYLNHKLLTIRSFIKPLNCESC